VATVSPADAQRLRQAQDGVRALIERDLRALVASLDTTRPEAALAAVREYVPVLVAQYGGSAAAVAADWYDEVRADARIPGRFRAAMDVPDRSTEADATVRRLAGAIFDGDPSAMLPGLLSAIPRLALTGARQTITTSSARDPQASGWQRVTRSGACGFCRMLAGRGGVYREATVHFASHGSCNCAAVPSWDPHAPEVDVTVYRASQRTSTMTPEQRERHRALVRSAVERYAPEE